MSAAAKTTSPAGAGLVVGALGVVFGDLGTSPLYTFPTIVQSIAGRFTLDSALGVLSLIFWTLLITVSVKYALFVMRADNDGEGGILALMALVGGNTLKGKAAVLGAMGLLGAALIYGDGAITPAISVLSALEGLEVAAPGLKAYVVPLAVAVLLGLFAIQSLGTSRIGVAFGPLMLVWFITIAALGALGIARHPAVLAAVNPLYGLNLLVTAGPRASLILGGVFLCITGAEALYADMGHFGRDPIRQAWFFLVLPALLLNYAGQTALLVGAAPPASPFYALAPRWGLVPLIVLATAATIVASQSIITGAFSMTRQAIQLGWLPSMNIRQTSDTAYGQIYVPLVNRLMAAATIAITLGFGSSDHLAGAYGTAVSTTMLLTTGLLATAMILVWRWPVGVAAPIAGFFLLVDIAFFLANLAKLFDGGWVPLSLGLGLFAIMAVWRWGVETVRGDLVSRSEGPEAFLARLASGGVVRAPGAAVFLSRTDDSIPPSVLQHVRFLHSLHETAVILNLAFEAVPRIASDRASAQFIGAGVWRVRIRYGFTEIPDIPAELAALKIAGLVLTTGDIVYISARDTIIARPTTNVLRASIVGLFAFLYRNAARVVDRFRLPPDAVVEIAREIAL